MSTVFVLFFAFLLLFRFSSVCHCVLITFSRLLLEARYIGLLISHFSNTSKRLRCSKMPTLKSIQFIYFEKLEKISWFHLMLLKVCKSYNLSVSFFSHNFSQFLLWKILSDHCGLLRLYELYLSVQSIHLSSPPKSLRCSKMPTYFKINYLSKLKIL